jgi:predicted nuclease of predicted toxin-antitoxin system
MKFLLDESAEFRIAAYLQTHGHDATAIAHDYPPSLPDREVLRLALGERRILITNDRDFGELIVRNKLSHAGVIYFRMGDVPLETKLEWLERLFRSHSDQLGHFIVVDRRGVVRVRR